VPLYRSRYESSCRREEGPRGRANLPSDPEAFVSVTIWFVRSEVEDFHQAQEDITALKQFQAAQEADTEWIRNSITELDGTIAELMKLAAENQRTIGKLEAHLAVRSPAN
jgi:hypothetical protein